MNLDWSHYEQIYESVLEVAMAMKEYEASYSTLNSNIYDYLSAMTNTRRYYASMAGIDEAEGANPLGR